MTDTQPLFPDLWPATQLMVTADTSDAVAAVLHPQSQMRFLDEMSTFAGPSVFADSLVYSTPHGNTGWTAMLMGQTGHVTYHHWDHARPNLLQLDVFGAGGIDHKRALSALTNFWVPLGMRTFVVNRPAPGMPLDCRKVRDDLVPRVEAQEGLGPGDHLHLLVDQIGGPWGDLKPERMDAALNQLVGLLRMRCMTPVLRHFKSDDGFCVYDAVVGITTSHISLRVRQAEDLTAICLDIFSCRFFETETVFRWLDRVLPATIERRGMLYNRLPLGEFREVG